jgi:N-acetyl-beta-hexosaminidase
MSAEFSPFPPYLYAMQVLDYMPSAAATYFMLWKDYFDAKGKKSSIIYDRKTIEQDRFMRWVKFNNDLNVLGKFGLLDRALIDEDKVSVELAAWNDS